MSAFAHFLRKEVTEIMRTWRLPTVGGVLLLFAVMSPLAALATPAIIASVTSAQPGLVIRVPDPTYLDSYAQWVKNLSQMGLLLVVFSSAGLIAGEKSSGTAVLIVTKPVSRFGIVVAKYVAQAGLICASVLIGTIVTYLGTVLSFGHAPLAVLVTSSAAWCAGALLAIAVTEVFSAAMPALAAGIAGLITMGVSGAIAIWEPAARYSPAGLLAAPGGILAGKHVALGWPLFASTVLVFALVAAAGWIFSRREL